MMRQINAARMSRKKEDGFTLIELMIVIAVIGILAVVFISKVGAVKTSAKSTGVDTNVRTVQAYVQSRITAWGDNTTTFTQAAIAADIAAALNSASEKMKNPFATSGSGEDIYDAVNNATSGLKTDTSQALQIVKASDEALAQGHGSVAVVIPADGAISNGIIINGLNQGGKVYSTVTIKP